MRKHLILMAFVMSCLACSGADALAPELEKVMAGLRSVTAVLSPAPEIRTNEASSLTVSYKTQIFKIHGGSMSGEFAREAHDEQGPTAQGFMLTVSVQQKGEINQGVVPQTLRAPYWQTYLQVTPVAGSDKQLFWGLSFGMRTDAKLLAQIREAVEGLKDNP